MLTSPDRSGADGGDVLVADDDPIFRSLMVRRLQQMGARPHEAEDGRIAWDLVAAEPIDLALIDLEMPNLKGIELIQCLRGHPRTRHVPIVVITLRTDSRALQEALAAGATAFLTKPLQWTTFASYVEFLLKLSTAAGRSQAVLDAVRDDAEALARRSGALLSSGQAPAAVAEELMAINTGLAALAGMLGSTQPKPQPKPAHGAPQRLAHRHIVA